MAGRVAATLRVKYKIDFIFDSEGPGRVAATQPVARWPLAMANGQGPWPQGPWPVATAMAICHGHEPWPLAMATVTMAKGYGHWLWPLAMARGHGQWPWPLRYGFEHLRSYA